MARVRFIFAGGGTGGHLYPGLAIAERLRARMGQDASCLFVCSQRPIDARILSEEKAEFLAIPARPVGASPRVLARFIWSWGGAVRAGRQVIRQARADFDRVVLVAMGGFVAAPMVMAARAEKQPVIMVNLDAAPGKANRWIARRAARVLTACPVEGRPGWTLVPPIVRAAARSSFDKPSCRARLGLDPTLATLMVTGGSQGALSVNQTVASVFALQGAAPTGWQVLHQCGKAPAGGGGSRDELIERYRQAGVHAVVEEFTNQMGLWWGAADLAVSRAGANSVAEAWANGVPTVFLPYPFHRDQHQRLNARPLEAAGAALIASDLVDPNRNASTTAPLIAALMKDPARLDSMRAALARLGPADGADRVAAALIDAANPQ